MRPILNLYMRKFFICVLIISISYPALYAQTTNTTFSSDSTSNNYSFLTELQTDVKGQGHVRISQDARITALLEKHIRINKGHTTIPGYRIRIFSNSGKSAKGQALSRKSDFMAKYPNIPTYFLFKFPNYKVYIGDFRTRAEALKVYKQIIYDFPDSFIVNDRINSSY